MKTTIYSITISIIYIPILFITIFVMGYVFFFISEYIYPFMLGLPDTNTWWSYLFRNLSVYFISGSVSAVFILHFYKSFNASVYIIPLIFTISLIVMEFVGMGFNFDSITNLISSIAMFVAFIYFLEDESFR